MKSVQGLFTNSLFFLGAALTAVSLQGWSAPELTPSLDLRPAWKSVAPEEWDPNVSFLNRIDPSASTFDFGEWIDPNRTRELREAYEANRRAYELQEQYHLSWQPYEQSYASWANGMSNQIINEIREHKLNEEKARLQDKVGLNDTKKELERLYQRQRASRSTLSRAAFALAGVAVLSTGSELKTELGQDTALYTSTNVPWKVAYVKLTSPIAESTVTYAGDGASDTHTFLPGPPGWLKTNERYTLNVARELPFWSLSAGVTYLGSSDLLTSTFTKPLLPNLVASYEATLPMTPTRPGAPLPENTLKVKYEKKF